MFTSRIALVTGCRGLLTCVGAVSLIALPAAAQEPPESIELIGVIRDFREAHPDFNVEPTGGNGHYAGNIDLSLSDEDRPVFTAGGYKVTSQWRTSGGEPIAPHMYRNPMGAGLRVVDSPTISLDVVMDSWDPSLGPYGGLNVGPAPDIEVGATMPTVTVPGDLGPSVGDVMLSGTVTINADIHCDDFTTDALTVILIEGNVRILCDGTFEVHQWSKVELLPGSTLTVYIQGGSASISQSSTVNMNTWDPSRCLFYFVGAGTFEISQDCTVCARIVAPDGTVQLDQNDHLYGSIVARTANFDQTTGYHAEAGIPPKDACDVNILDSAGTAGVASDGGIESADTFDEWYRDKLGANVSTSHTITLLRNADGVYELLSDEFYPIDRQLYGNQGDDHNNYFTYAINAAFTYESCTGQFLEFAGMDDVWMFVDGKLVIDRGGVIPGSEQSIEMDRLGLEDGMTYEVHFFYAHRQPWQSVFHLRTNILLSNETVVAAATWPFD
ncbi:MAG: fibro-slime domain-containing protein [Planctomycetota bacterium]|jgi:fibro-slime domain-containing protein